MLVVTCQPGVGSTHGLALISPTANFYETPKVARDAQVSFFT